ncbi:hypothetical protein OH76DRAFT_1412395 [Lentinus brumalis]|uniref:Uncharacterized protein n=1 Tax=Lentinus brumalis TaxID=2498619 RepID=A0A371CLD2_9APHY|nr:hypothetical protein OH76DRAFT_1412395 [Polyporus brumalis]
MSSPEVSAMIPFAAHTLTHSASGYVRELKLSPSVSPLRCSTTRSRLSITSGWAAGYSPHLLAIALPARVTSVW